MLPVIVSQLVVLVKDTALGYIIGYTELLQSGVNNLSANYGNIGRRGHRRRRHLHPGELGADRVRPAGWNAAPASGGKAPRQGGAPPRRAVRRHR